MEAARSRRAAPDVIATHRAFPENRRLFPRLTVAENLKRADSCLRARQHAAGGLRLLSFFPRMKVAAPRCRTLSAGEQQCARSAAPDVRPKLLRSTIPPPACARCGSVDVES